MSQRDTHASVELARASTRDSSSMKVIAFVTVLFLPATFVSVCANPKINPLFKSTSNS